MSPKNPEAAALVSGAKVALTQAEHYNNFFVSCIAVGENGKVYHGANTKKTKDAEPECAEKKVANQVEADGTLLKTIVVLGPLREEEKRDKKPTLHCCEARCLPMLKKYYQQRKVVKRDTHFAFVNSETGHVEEFTLEELFQEHKMSLDD